MPNHHYVIGGKLTNTYLTTVGDALSVLKHSEFIFETGEHRSDRSGKGTSEVVVELFWGVCVGGWGGGSKTCLCTGLAHVPCVSEHDRKIM